MYKLYTKEKEKTMDVKDFLRLVKNSGLPIDP